MKIRMILVLSLSLLCAVGYLSQSVAQGVRPPLAASEDSSQAIADRIVKSKIPVMIDFWAAWCSPCRMLNPIMAELEKEYDGKVEFMKINVDVHRAISAYFRVNSIPSVYIVHDKNVVKHLPGLQPKEMYKSAIAEVLALAAKKPEPADSLKK
ncbi:MAG: thioredoxin [Chitinispirillaceae bacterium]|nr:thioredoxin [Chitinispirillaceae bacterium]